MQTDLHNLSAFSDTTSPVHRISVVSYYMIHNYHMDIGMYVGVRMQIVIEKTSCNTSIM